jgi:Ca2+-binding EF-hand superfamily protein
MDEVPERDEIDEFFNTYDKDADGRVTFEEILASDAEGRVKSTAQYTRAVLSQRDMHAATLCTRIRTALCHVPRAHP